MVGFVRILYGFRGRGVRARIGVRHKRNWGRRWPLRWVAQNGTGPKIVGVFAGKKPVSTPVPVPKSPILLYSAMPCRHSAKRGGIGLRSETPYGRVAQRQMLERRALRALELVAFCWKRKRARGARPSKKRSLPISATRPYVVCSKYRHRIVALSRPYYSMGFSRFSGRRF